MKLTHAEFSRKGGQSKSIAKLNALKLARKKAMVTIKQKFADIHRRKTTKKSTLASRKNGKLGGRPKKYRNQE